MHAPLLSRISAFLLLLMIALQMAHLRTPTPLQLPAPGHVVTAMPKAGVHTRLTGVGDESFIATQLDLVANMGSPWIVELFPWAYAQPRSAYGYDWHGFDMVIEHARRRGITVIARLDIVPAWARPSESSDRLLLPDAYPAYAQFVAAFAARYAPLGVHHLLLWNEPNLRFEWGGRNPDPEAYAHLLATVTPVVKAVAPQSIIIAGALSPGPDIGANGEIRINDRAYTERFFAAGGGQFIDAWAVHAYGGQLPPDDAPSWQTVNLRRVELVADLIAQYGHFPIYVTEAGWNDHERWQLAVSPAQRIRWSQQAYTLANNWSNVTMLALWQFGLPQPSRTYQDGWLIIGAEQTPRAIYYELHDWLRTIQQPPP